ncbi:MAG: biotin carboxylase N-terminal domain-containing protein [Candidatus Korobacteraceae bacterium]
MQHEFQRVVIVNRGEAAMRFIHAAREFNHEHGTALRTIALYTDPDRNAMFVREADEALSIGASQFIDPKTNQSKSSYVDYARLKQALTTAGAEAVWVGWGFVAEHAEFAALCQEMNIVFIGPDAAVMRRLGDKISSKRLAEQAHIPIAPWSGGPVETLEDAVCHAEQLGYPLLIKATAGGGGHGIRRVNSADELANAFAGARGEAAKAFGDATVFMEHLVDGGARHVEVQIIADHYGTTWAAGVRDCTVQRRHQKVMEEAPSPALSHEVDQALREAAVRLSKAAEYRNAGTVEFLYQPAGQRFLFMEMNTRLQVEHPVTECTTRLDLVKLQIHVARGGRLEGAQPRTIGHAIEVRLNAEDPENGFAPGPGTIERFMIATGPGIRIDTGVSVGDAVPPEFDSMVAKIIAFGQSREEALSRIQRVLRESVVVIKGGATNKAFLLELLSRPEILHGQVDVGWLDRLAANGEHLSRRFADVALVQAAIEVYNADLAVEKAQFYTSAVRGRPQVRREAGREVKLRYRGQAYSMKTYCLGPERYRIEVDGAHVDAHLHPLGPFEYWLTTFGQRSHVVSVVQGVSYRIEVDGVSHRIERDDGGVVHAPAPAVVVSIAVKPGDTVAAGDRLLVLEAMKMETQVVAPFSGKVRQVMTIPNVQVDTGAPLIQIEPSVEAEPVDAMERVVFGTALTEDEFSHQAHWRKNLDELRQLMLGFDIDPVHTAKTFAQWSRFREASDETKEIRRQEDEILSIFVDICSVFRRNPIMNGLSGGEAPSPEAYLFSYLRMIKTQGEGLPPAFVEALRRVLAHYGINTLNASPQLEETLLWIYKSHEAAERQIAPIISVLERRLPQGKLEKPETDQSFRTLLDRLVSITYESFPTVSHFARELRYRCFDQPVFERALRQVYAQMEADIAYLAAYPEASDREARVRALIDCPQPLVGLLSGRFATASLALRELMLEVLTARYYRAQNLTGLRSLALDGQRYILAQYEDEGRRLHLFTTHSEYSGLTESARGLIPLIQEVPAGHGVTLDFYVWHAAGADDPESMQQELQAMLNQAGFPASVERIVVALGAPGHDSSIAGVRHFTYALRDGVYAEDKLFRGIHPMMANRLHLWRLKNFKIERLPSVEDVYLLHAVAHENPKDERLFACAEIRDLTPVRDEAGRVHLPHLERMFAETLAAIRLFQMRRPPQKRLYWNRMLLNVWPPLNFSADEMHDFACRMAPATDGLGLEQVAVLARIPHPQTGELRDMLVRISNPGSRTGLVMTVRPATQLEPLKPLAEYDQKVVKMRQRGLVYPYEIVKLLTPATQDTRAELPAGEFVEYDLDADNQLVPVERPYGKNKANIIVGVIRNFTPKYPEGMTRVILLGDPSKGMGALAEAECRRINAGLDLADKMHVPLEWFALSGGAKIAMDSGVENMDWIARVLRRLIEFTQAGGEVNVVVNGINVGAQPYWNAEATMLLHTRGILIMTPLGAMVLTGKRALDYSGSVSAEDNLGIGGYDRIMGLNGQAQYFARDIDEACRILFRHYDHTYLIPGERFPRRAVTVDPIERDVREYAHGVNGVSSFALVGDIFSDETNAGRKKPFEIRRVLAAVADQDHRPLERWSGMRGAETVVVWDAHLGGYPVCMLGIESHPVPRLGFVPADGPDYWTAGTLFPASSKKAARAINAASNNRPLVLLANLSGFDGSPESLRKLQLEYGAEIGRAVVNFKGPMVFCVISRYHGGAYVVFSQVLNENLEVVALEGTYASVIGGAPAAAVVFSSEVEARARKDERLQALTQAMEKADGVEKGRLQAQWQELFPLIHSEKLGEVAEEFDHIHSVHRALEVGALHRIIPPATLRPYLIQAVERGIKRETESPAEKAAVGLADPILTLSES